MQNTPQIRAIIDNAMKAANPPVTNTELAQKLGVGKAWVTKLLNGTIKQLRWYHVEKIERLLNVSFTSLKREGISPLAQELAEALDRRPDLEPLFHALLQVSRVDMEEQHKH